MGKPGYVDVKRKNTLSNAGLLSPYDKYQQRAVYSPSNARTSPVLGLDVRRQLSVRVSNT